jgi:hypothetical protein
MRACVQSGGFSREGVETVGDDRGAVTDGVSLGSDIELRVGTRTA